MSKSVKRVEQAAIALGLRIDVTRMTESTRTAEDAAFACGCDVKQIVKSLIFEGSESRELKLILVSGAHGLNQDAISKLVGERLDKARPDRVRKETGFAIGGVAPIGAMCELDTYVDQSLLGFGAVWVAAGAPDAVFQINPQDLVRATRATPFHNATG